LSCASYIERHICYYCLLAANQGNNVRGFFLKKKLKQFLSIDVRITMISGVVYLLRIFKMFHELMNNPVYCCLRMSTYIILFYHFTSNTVGCPLTKF